MRISIHPNFRNGGAERSLLNAEPGNILTYGPAVDAAFAGQFDNVVICRNRLAVFFVLLKHALRITPTDGRMEIVTNQISAAYFWLLAVLPGVRVLHHQRLSLHGELFLAAGILKRILVFVAFQMAPLCGRVIVPSKGLMTDYKFFKSSIVHQRNKIALPADWQAPKSPREGIVIVARDAPEKRLRDTLRLLNALVDDETNVTLIGCDTAFQFDNLAVRSLGNINDRKAYFDTIAAHRLAVLFSEAEGFGNVIPEFIFAGVWPVVNQCAWGPAETVNEFGVGTVLDWRWGEALSDIENKSFVIKTLLNQQPAISNGKRAEMSDIFSASL